ncbi:hypothetical protein F66182_17547, partial [Fusarium sp. NRRL 66182]
MTKIFLTGATGYIGGEALYAIHKKHPEFSFSVLVRDASKNDAIKAAFPSVRIVNGALDDFELLKKEAADADIVTRPMLPTMSSPRKQSPRDSPKATPPPNTGYWLHTGGTGILTFRDSDRKVFGEYDDKIYDDWDGVDELTHLPDHAFHRNVDQIVLEAGTKNGDRVKTALLCPPTIYGPGRGPINQNSRQVYALASMTLQIKKAPLLGAGKSVWNNVHIHDLGNLFVLLTEAAVAGRHDDGLWGADGYYLVENGEHVWGDVSRSIAEIAAKEGYIPAPTVETVDIETCEKFAGYQALSWGMNSRGKARRAA